MSKNGEWVDIGSAYITAAQYNETTQALTIRFYDGYVYCYTPVLRIVFDGLLTTSSVGDFFYQHIYRPVLKGTYGYTYEIR